jgi:hypothetical protein
VDANVSVGDSHHDGAASRAVTALQKIMVGRIERFLRRRARDHGVPRSERAHTGAVIAIQRFGSRLNLHIHFHAVIPDAVWVLRDGALVVVNLPPPSDDDVDTIVRDVCRRVTAYIDRRTDDGTLSAPTTDDDCDNARDLAQLVLSDTVARKPSILDDFPAAAPSPRKLTAHCDGFSLECKPSVTAADRAGLERLLPTWVTRPTISCPGTIGNIELTPFAARLVDIRMANPRE